MDIDKEWNKIGLQRNINFHCGVGDSFFDATMHLLKYLKF
jgi:hypothetical protein